MDLPEEYYHDCQQQYLENKAHIQAGRYYNELYNQVITCITRKKNGIVVEELERCLKKNNMDYEDFSFLRTRTKICKEEINHVYENYQSILINWDAQRTQKIRGNPINWTK
eukprot:TRINITY_DN5064_c0_g1_i1.p1 TRINITY_DN5064_c0_g1~~TRINITY_DN5064_c0_g1_i1.p1  ORF type:complete len:111 (-),score=27.28 TRINITY_DN5064_c0_g1_i1:45-377(-)